MNNFLNQIQALNKAFSESERKWLTEVSVLKQREQAIREELQQARRHCELDAVKISEYEKRECELQARIESTVDELRRLERERSERERVQTELVAQTTEKAHAEAQTHLHTLAQREQAVVAQLLAIQQQAAQEKAELARSHSEQEHALHRQHAEREQTLSQQLQAGQEELRRLEQDRVQREREHAEQTSQTREELESLLRTLAEREQAVVAQLLAIQQQAAQEKAELARSHSEQEHALHRQHAEREQTLSQQLQAGQEELRRLEQDRVQREREHAEQTNQTREELESLLRTLAEREQAVVAQLLAIQQQAAQEKAELARSHSEQEHALHRQHAEREQTLSQQLQAGQEELRRLEQDRVQREREHAEQTSQTREELESLLRTLAQREQAVAAQLLAIQQQAAQEKAELAQSHSEQTQELQCKHAEREQVLTQQLQAKQAELHSLEQDWVQHEKVQNKEISDLQSEKQELNYAQRLQAQHHQAELKTKLDEHNRLIEACAAVEAQLKAEILSEQQTSLRLGQSLAQVQQSLATTHASLTWRMTAPLRTLALVITQKKNLGPASPVMSDTELPNAIMPSNSESQPINVQHSSIESIMLSTVQTAPPIASTLDELLAYHDQQFVHCAYQTLLGRAPDPEGCGYYLGRLRTGFSKMRIVAQLRSSKEGKARAKERKALAKKEKTQPVSLPGLDKAIKRYRRGQYPLMGWLFRWLYGTESNHPTERKLRSIENQLFLLSDESNRRFNQLETALAGLHHLVAQQTQSVVTALGGTPSLISDTSSASPIQSSEPDGLKQLPPRARDIYFQLKTAAAIHAKRTA